MLWRIMNRNGKVLNQGSTLDKSLFRRSPFNHQWNNLARMYDLRMWYLKNSHNDIKRREYVQQLEDLQKEMNTHAINISSIRILSVILLFYFIRNFIHQTYQWDWNENYDPKFDKAIYGDLEDGGEEGADDDEDDD